MLYPKPSVRPERFRLNIYSPLYQGLYFAFLGGPPRLKTSESIPEYGPRRMAGWYNNYPGYSYVFDPYLKRSAVYANNIPRSDRYVTYGPVSQIFSSNALSIGLFHYVYYLDWDVSFAICNTVNRQRPRVEFYRAANAEYGLNQGDFGVVFFQTTVTNIGDGIRTIPASEYAANTWFYSSFSATMNGGQIDIVPYNRGRRLSGKSINISDSSSDSWNIRLCGDVYNNNDRGITWDGLLADVMIWTRILRDSEHAALADPDNVDLRVPGGPPLILHERTFWPGFSLQVPQAPSSKKTPIHHLVAGCT
jgi:hypothetical protein